MATHGPHRPSALRIISIPTFTLLYTPLPISPSRSQRNQQQQQRSISKPFSPSVIPSPPATPPPWTWTCHQCRSTFPLGATRRCLHDGHQFCAGASLDRRTGRVRRHKPCGSTFDYVGWKAYGAWRADVERLAKDTSSVPTPATPVRSPRSARTKVFRKVGGLRLSTSPTSAKVDGADQESPSPLSSPKNCERNCAYPSECRWNPKPKRESKNAGGKLATENKEKGKHDQSPRGTELPVLALDLATEELGTMEPEDPEKALLPTSAPRPPKSTSPKFSKSAVSPTKVDNDMLSDFRAPVLDFAAFRARLDRASARRRSKMELPSKVALPELDLGGPMVLDMDMHITSSESELPANDEIQDPYHRDDEDNTSLKSMSSEESSDVADEEIPGPGAAAAGDQAFAATDLAALGSVSARKVASGPPYSAHDQKELARLAGWNWSLGGLGSREITGMDLAGLIGVNEEAFALMIKDENEPQMI